MGKVIEQRAYAREIGSNRPFGVVVASVDTDNPGIVRFGYAQCNPKDNFSKQRGYEIARNRMNWSPVRENDKRPILNRTNVETVDNTISTLVDQHPNIDPLAVVLVATIEDVANHANWLITNKKVS